MKTLKGEIILCVGPGGRLRKLNLLIAVFVDLTDRFVSQLNCRVLTKKITATLVLSPAKPHRWCIVRIGEKKLNMIHTGDGTKDRPLFGSKSLPVLCILIIWSLWSFLVNLFYLWLASLVNDGRCSRKSRGRIKNKQTRRSILIFC